MQNNFYSRSQADYHGSGEEVAGPCGDHDGLLPMSTMLDQHDMQFPQFPPMFNDPLPAKPTAPEAHDDMCLDNCTGVGVYPDANNFNYRGAQPSYGHLSAPHLQHSQGQLHDPQSQIAYQLSAWNDDQDRRESSQRPSWTNYQHRPERIARRSRRSRRRRQIPNWQEPMFSGSPQDDEESCCSSECNMANKCSDAACADEADACTDRTCPERLTLDMEDANVAATLMDISHAQQQPNLSYGLYPHDSTFEDMMNLSSHIETSHSDPNSFECAQECPLLSPTVWQRCAFPKDHAEADFSGYNPMGGAGYPPGVAICGAETSGPNDLVHHYFVAHSGNLHAHTGHDGHNVSGSMVAPGHDGHGVSGLVVANISNDSSPMVANVSNDSSPMVANDPSPMISNLSSPMVPNFSNESSPIVETPDWEVTCFWRDGENECGRVCQNTKELNDHVVHDHVKQLGKVNNSFHCGWRDCPRATNLAKPGFPQRSKLERHMQTHVGYKPFTCERCKGGFSGKQALEQHELTHDGKKPFHCTECTMAFASKSSLTMHKRTHTKEKPLKCPLCPKWFSESSNLSKHKRIHEKVARYPCLHPGCDKRFNRQDQLRRHRNAKHKH